MPTQSRVLYRGWGVVAGMALLATACASGSASGAQPAGPTATPVSPSPSASPSPAAPGPGPTPTLVPGTQLTGAGAFEGPVRQAPVNGIKIGYRQFGTGPDLIMVTGDSVAMSLWTVDLLTKLAQHFRVTIFDNRGVGYSTENPAQPITIPLMADDTVGLIQALGLRSPTLLGWSMGGEIGLTVAALHPGLLTRLVSTSGDAGSPHAVQPSPEIQKELDDPNTTPAQFLDLLFPASAVAAKQAFATQYLLVPQQSASPRVLHQQYEAEGAFAADTSTWDALPSITIPVLVTNGTEDVVVPATNATMLKERIPNATLTLFDGAGHGMLFQDTARFVGIVAEFAR